MRARRLHARHRAHRYHGDQSHLYASPGYDPLTDLVPITRLGAGPQVLVVHRGYRRFGCGLLACQGQPDELSSYRRGIGTPGHLASSMLLYLTKPRRHIPYRAAGRRRGPGRRHVTWT